MTTSSPSLLASLLVMTLLELMRTYEPVGSRARMPVVHELNSVLLVQMMSTVLESEISEKERLEKISIPDLANTAVC